MDKIKALWEQWDHRLKGHMLMTVVVNSRALQFWISAIYSEDEELWADMADGTGAIRITDISLLPVTITGA